MKKRPSFYPNGEIIDYKLPQTFQKSKSRAACGNCAWFSNRRSYCFTFNSMGVKDNYICHKWKLRTFVR